MKNIFWLLLACALVGGCAGPKIDWQARVGVYTYDQAVVELGPPDKSAKLSDGSTVADWLTQRGQVVVSPDPYFFGPGYIYGPFPPMYSQTYMPARFLRLTFDANQKLKAWKKYAR